MLTLSGRSCPTFWELAVNSDVGVKGHMRTGTEWPVGLVDV